MDIMDIHKNQAKELVNKFIPMATDLTPVSKIERDYRWAKKCALICIEREMELLNRFCDDGLINNNQYHTLLNSPYSIKLEIQKL